MSIIGWLIGRRHPRSGCKNSNSVLNPSRTRTLELESLERRLCPGVLTLTSASIRAGYGISTFATDFTSQGAGAGVLSVLFAHQGGVLVTDMSGNVRLFPNDSDGQSAAYVPPT